MSSPVQAAEEPVSGDHTACKEYERPNGYIEHVCGPCPHGFIKGGLLGPRSPYAEHVRRLKLRSIDELRCEDHHPEMCHA